MLIDAARTETDTCFLITGNKKPQTHTIWKPDLDKQLHVDPQGQEDYKQIKSSLLNFIFFPFKLTSYLYF